MSANSIQLPIMEETSTNNKNSLTCDEKKVIYFAVEKSQIDAFAESLRFFKDINQDWMDVFMNLKQILVNSQVFEEYPEFMSSHYKK